MTERLEEIMEEVEIVVDGITDEVRGYELTKEQYEWFLLQASKVRELEEHKELALEMEKAYRLTKQQNQRLKQVLEFYANKDNYELWESAEDLMEYVHDVDFDGGEKARKALEREG